LTDCAAATLAAAVTADMTICDPRAASPAEEAQPTPVVSPACLSRSPAGSGNRMSHAAIRPAPASRNPAAIAWPASPKPMKQIAGFTSPIVIASSTSALADDGRIGVWSAMASRHPPQQQDAPMKILSCRDRLEHALFPHSEPDGEGMRACLAVIPRRRARPPTPPMRGRLSASRSARSTA
jgi:hypothetical protein